MKSSLLLFVCLIITKFLYSQQIKQKIDYQYFRDAKEYYAFESYIDLNDADKDKIYLNFSSNIIFNQIEKIFIKVGEIETKLKFKTRNDTVKSDNAEIKFYPIMFSVENLNLKLDCDATILFKLNNGLILSLPFNTCNYNKTITKH